MKVLVTGGAGFVGSHLTEELVKQGHRVTVLDDFSLGKMDNLKLVKNEVDVVKGSICDKNLVKKTVKGNEIVFNLAAASSSPMFLEDLNYAVSVNVDGFINILNACRDSGVGKLIYASTSSIYGNSKPPLKEDMPTPPVNFYASSKLMNEHLAALFSKQYNLETVGFRFLSVYGPHEKAKGIYANLASQFLWSMQKGDQPVVYGNGTQTREFTFVLDIVQAHILAMNSTKVLSGEVFNVGTGKAHSLNDLVKTIGTVIGSDIKPKYVPNTVKNYINTQLSDISKIKKMLGYKPKYDLKSGIEEIISWQKSQ